MGSRRWSTFAEGGCMTILIVWLISLPLPFGSVIEAARIPLVAVPLVTCACAALIRLQVTQDRSAAVQSTRAWIIFASGGALVLLLGLLQLVPLPAPVLRLVSPESHAIWSRASHIADLAGVEVATMHPVSIDPAVTAFELFRLLALLAAFMTAALLIRNHTRRVMFATALCGIGIFEAMYGLREAALQRYEIWGWVNRLIFNRVTGTFVNPNHFGHYLAIVLPMALFLLGLALHRAGSRDTPLAQRIAHLLERGVIRAGFALLASGACVAGVLLSASRGALLALASGLLFVAALIPGRRLLRSALFATAGLAFLVSLVVFLGPERTVSRFLPNQYERETFVGRKIGISAALGVWKRFPATGSGLGTFERIVSMEQTGDLGKIYHHAHNDYLEIAATGGGLVFVIALATLLGGYAALVQMTFGRRSSALTWRRRAFQVAALASLSIAMVHALFDFNFYIPSNPATLAAIVGVAVASVDHDKRSRL